MINRFKIASPAFLLMLLHTSSFWLSGLLWEGWGMAERQQTFARNHRDVCAGLTGTNITITLILERFGKQLCLQWYHILFDAYPHWCHFLYSAAARDGILHDFIPANPQGGKEVWCLEETQCYTTQKKLFEHLMYYFKPRFMPSQTITSENEAVFIRFHYVEQTVDIFARLLSGSFF